MLKIVAGAAIVCLFLCPCAAGAGPSGKAAAKTTSLPRPGGAALEAGIHRP